jgi:hypothetical protein
VWLGTAIASYADQNKPPKEPKLPKNPPAAAKIERPTGPNAGVVGGGAPKGVGKLPNPDNPIARLRAMTPEQRERAIEKLTPQQQVNARRMLENFDKQNDAQKQKQLGWANEFYSLPPDKQGLVRAQIKAMNALPPDRLREVRSAYARLSNSTPEQRAEILARPQFQKRFSPEELQMLTVLPEYWPLPKQ